MTYFLKILVTLILLNFAGLAHAVIPDSERTVLTELYNSANGANWNNKTGWNGAVGTECDWHGVSCDVTGSNVATINLAANNLVGTLPSLSGLTALSHFYVYNNQLTGSIPTLSGLTALQFFVVEDNQLTGSIPSLSGLTALQDFDVNNNQLTGAIPPLSGLTVLQYFDVNDNLLIGAVPAPPNSLHPGYTSLCGNSLVSSGNPDIDAAWVTASGTNWLSCQTLAISSDRVFAYAEANYPDIFSGTASTEKYLTYNYRYYPDSENHLAIDDSDDIYILGPNLTNNEIVLVGPVESFRSVITDWEATLSP